MLTQQLLKDGHTVMVVDTQWFGNYLQPHDNLTVVKQDIREVDAIPLEGVESIIHLANIANDPAVELSPTLSWEVNVLAGQQLIDRAVRHQVRQFIFASSGSVYGVNDAPDVTEDQPLVPLTAYNKTKMVAERVFLSYTDQIKVHCIRPSSVCGWSPRMRLDVAVNMITFRALNNGKITVYGGQQTRPNIHVKDIVRVYQHFLANPGLPYGLYNAGFENFSILEIAERVQAKIGCDIEITETNDPRSYRQYSDKLFNTGFKKEFSVDDAIGEIVLKYNSGELTDNDIYYTVRTMKKLQLDENRV